MARRILCLGCCKSPGTISNRARRLPFIIANGAWQPGLEPLKKRGIHFHEGLPQTADLDTWYPPEGGLLILDDLMEEGGNDKQVLDLFTKHLHHRHITVLYLCQNLFPPGKYAKTISRNAHYVVAFKNPRDQLGIRNLMMQACSFVAAPQK